MSRWIGVDFDGTIAEYNGWKGPTDFGKPIKPMVDRIKRWLSRGFDVQIVTARANDDLSSRLRQSKSGAEKISG